MPRSRTSLLFAILAAGALVLSGCGSSDDSGGGGAAAPTTTASGAYGQPAASTPAAGGAAAGELVAKDIAFNPTKLSFKGGGTISFKFTNEDSVEHNFTLEGVSGVDEDAEAGEDVDV